MINFNGKQVEKNAIFKLTIIYWPEIGNEHGDIHRKPQRGSTPSSSEPEHTMTSRESRPQQQAANKNPAHKLPQRNSHARD